MTTILDEIQIDQKEKVKSIFGKDIELIIQTLNKFKFHLIQIGKDIGKIISEEENKFLINMRCLRSLLT